MSLSKKEIEHIARLARLALTDEELTLFAGQMSAILEYVDELKQVDVEGVAPTHHATGVKNIFRADEVTRPDDHTEKFLTNAPVAEKNQIKVRAVLEDRE